MPAFVVRYGTVTGHLARIATDEAVDKVESATRLVRAVLTHPRRSTSWTCCDKQKGTACEGPDGWKVGWWRGFKVAPRGSGALGRLAYPGLGWYHAGTACLLARVVASTTRFWLVKAER
jgi:hypothetical protein